MKKYLAAFVSVLAFSAPAMASEQAIEFMSDAQLGQHNGAKLMTTVDSAFGPRLDRVKASEVMGWIGDIGGGNVTINGETFTTKDSLGKTIHVRVAALRTRLAFMDAQRFRTHVVTRDGNNVIITTK